MVPTVGHVLATLRGRGDWPFLQMKAQGLERSPDLLKVMQEREEDFNSGLSDSCYHITQEVPCHLVGRDPHTECTWFPTTSRQGA